MTERVKVDPCFTSIVVRDMDELFRNGAFEWNVTRLIEAIDGEGSEFSVTPVDILPMF
ncbi:hypothetical protein [Paenibacillus sp.]|uniref:hypothetical protein n=1 Tax=Paenibacillus sp. TaxID=58172 RepID=UPI00281107E5|nr:hypothetical protein [Paenibacillus sp.]